MVIGGPHGIGKTDVAKAIGHEACRAGHQGLFRKTQKLLSEVLADSAERGQRILRKELSNAQQGREDRDGNSVCIP